MDVKETFADNIHIKTPEYDVVEMDFPEYTEEFPPIGTVISEKSFSANKIEIYRRNTEIVLSEQKKTLEKALAEKSPKSADQEEYEKLCREADKIMEQTEDMQKLAENLSPDALMNLMFNSNRQAESEPTPLIKKIMASIVKVATFLLLILLIECFIKL